MKIFLFIFISCLIFNKAQSIEIKIIHNIKGEIITNVDVKNEFKYLVAMNNTLKELDKDKILNISNESIIKEKIKKIEISKFFDEIKIDEKYLNVLLKSKYSRLGLKSPNEFQLYLKDYGLTLNDIVEKITINALWNEMIIEKYSSQVAINKKKIEKEVSKNREMLSKEYRLSEITFAVKNNDEIQKKYKEISNSINEVGFKNSASIYSFSESAKIGGDIGWINENSLNEKIRSKINDLKIGEISKPIILPNGILILTVVDSKNSKIKIDLESELKNAISYERNRQLSQYSRIYYNKIKKNLEFNG